MMLLYPIPIAINDINIHLGLKMSQNKSIAIRVMRINAKPNPIKDMNHHFCGLR